MVEVDRVDFFQVHEVLDLDRAREQRFESRQLARLNGHVAVGRYLIARDDLPERDLFPVDRADVLLVDAPAVKRVDLMEVHRLARDRAVQLHRHADQSEAECPHPHRPWHLDTS